MPVAAARSLTFRSPAGAAGRPHARAVGFTLLEVLIALALIALLSGLFIVGTGRLLADRSSSPDEIFWKAVNESRKYALTHNLDVRLVFDAKTKAFVATTLEGTESFPVPYKGELAMDFLSADLTGRSTIMLGGSVMETNPMRHVTFYADGTCSPFRLQIRTGGPGRIIEIDPWTCAPMLSAVPERG